MVSKHLFTGPDPVRVSARFKRSLRSYERQGTVQKKCTEHLLDLTQGSCGSEFQRVLEIGSGTGRLTEALCRRFSLRSLFVNDLVPELCQFSTERVAGFVSEVVPLPGDIEHCTLPQRLDLIISSATLQWLRNIRGCINIFAEHLNSGGFLVFSLFSEGTMRQIRSLTGVGLEYLTEKDLRKALADSLHVHLYEQRHHTIYFENPRQVLRHIQETGVGGVTDFRWTVTALRRFERQYREQFTTSQGLSLDYVSTYVIAEKREEGQL